LRNQAAVFGLFLGLAHSVPGLAFEPVAGDFLAKQACPATASIKRAKPDDAKVQEGSVYSAIGLNKPNGDYVQVRVPGAQPEQRWVRLDCGELRSSAIGESPGPSRSGSAAASTGDNRKYLLAISWQPAFCESKPDKTECRTETAARFDADHFTLHGLWPQPERNAYCGVSARDRAVDERHDWEALPEPDISPATRGILDVAMPGTVSNLQRHEWTRHGTCFGTSADAYFRTALGLLDQINRSKLREFMAGHIGDTVTAYQLKAEFERSFGPGAGAALSVRCSGNGQRRMVSEIRISLKGALSETEPLSKALDASVPVRSTCDRAAVDRAGVDVADR
jgi:ribonuclease T2